MVQPVDITSALIPIWGRVSLNIVAVITHTTKRIGEFEVVAHREYATVKEAREVERSLKAKKNRRLAIFQLQK